MNCCLDLIPTTANWIKSILKVDGKKEIFEKNMFPIEEGNLIISSCIICFANARNYSE